MAKRIHELAIKRSTGTEYIYFARIGGKWTDLAPYGNRLPEGVRD
jgi:hypothetical protein